MVSITNVVHINNSQLNIYRSSLVDQARETNLPIRIRPPSPRYVSFLITTLIQPYHSHTTRIFSDPIFEATQDIAYNTALIKYNEGIVQKCEQEIVVLKDVDAATSVWWGSRAAVDNRREYLLGKMRTAGTKVEQADRQNTNLKKVLAKGG